MLHTQPAPHNTRTSSTPNESLALSPLFSKISQTPLPKPFPYKHFQKVPGGWVPFAHDSAAPPRLQLFLFEALAPQNPVAHGYGLHPTPPLFFRRISFQRSYSPKSRKNINLQYLHEFRKGGFLGSSALPFSETSPQPKMAGSRRGRAITADRSQTKISRGCFYR
jgi:hypothetical protein